METHCRTGLMIIVQLWERSAAEELTIVSVTAVRQALCSSGDKREKFLSHHVFTKCSATHLKTQTRPVSGQLHLWPILLFFFFTSQTKYFSAVQPWGNSASEASCSGQQSVARGNNRTSRDEKVSNAPLHGAVPLGSPPHSRDSSNSAETTWQRHVPPLAPPTSNQNHLTSLAHHIRSP